MSAARTAGMWMCADDGLDATCAVSHRFFQTFLSVSWDLAYKNWHALQWVMGIFDVNHGSSVMPPELSRLQRNYVLSKINSFNFVGHCALHFKALPCNNQLEVVRCQFTSRSVFFFLCVWVPPKENPNQAMFWWLTSKDVWQTNSGIHHLHHVSMASWTSWFGVAADLRQRTRVGSRKSTQAFDEAKKTALLAATTWSRDLCFEFEYYRMNLFLETYNVSVYIIWLYKYVYICILYECWISHYNYIWYEWYVCVYCKMFVYLGYLFITDIVILEWNMQIF